jgi:hypothetical protein
MEVFVGKSGDAGLTKRQFVMAMERLCETVQMAVSPVRRPSVHLRIRKYVSRREITMTASFTTDPLFLQNPNDITIFLTVSAVFPHPPVILVESNLDAEFDPAIMKFLRLWGKQFRYGRFSLTRSEPEVRPKRHTRGSI